jgi:hypothetical protein
MEKNGILSIRTVYIVIIFKCEPQLHFMLCLMSGGNFMMYTGSHVGIYVSFYHCFFLCTSQL